jgi:myo-inositol-1(or 4)-monophosphatase
MNAHPATFAGGAAPNDLAPEEAAQALAEAVTEAGEIALAMLRAGCRNWTKEHDSPVTEADLAADALLRERLRFLAPQYGWRSEESDPVPARRGARVWIVDPIDGTRAFMRELPDWVVSAALVEDGRPLAAALFAPVTGELFVAVRGTGATRNGVQLAASAAHSLAGARIAGPRTQMAEFEKRGYGIETVPRIHSLALRIARVATGEIDAALASAMSRDWDLAAADLIVHEAGAKFTTSGGARLVYDLPESGHPPLAAAGNVLHGTLLAAIADIADGTRKMEAARMKKVVEP